VIREFRERPGYPPAQATRQRVVVGIEQQIEENLRRIYDQYLHEGVPERLQVLLDRLDEESE